MTEWDLSKISEEEAKSNRPRVLGGWFLSLFLLALGGFSAAIRVSSAEGWTPLPIVGATFLIAAGSVMAWWSRRLSWRGATRVKVDSTGVTLWYSRYTPSQRSLSWTDAAFRLKMTRLAAPQEGSTGSCYETALRWPKSKVTDEVYFGVLGAAREAGMSIRERTLSWGWYTSILIRPSGTRF